MYSLPLLVRLCSKSFKLSFSSTWIKNLQIYKLGLEKAEEPEIKLPINCWIIKKAREFQETSASVSLTMLKRLPVWIITNCGKLLKRWDNQTILPVSWETCLLLHSATTGKVLWYFYIFNNFPQFVVIHTVKDLNVVNEAEVDVFLEFSCFLYDAVGGYWQFDFWFRGTTECCTLKAEKADTFSKSSLYVW